ncbi:MlaC/ttg2D family ABC transporter substrate-binding protein [Curvivirga aplysinae]|uniref:MlaC/ttg2D family ABC transporter substrate-binding protein n=1 Tax=Curvivirga aplysinae TaxID=2529852 RepID=UPI0012BCC267|nr:ABC transporter substrate-binding protein [Curvivirga aplysinae]MTI09669.1 ABC transporter substrate-binding protein [Curvivirga aplysinae]
MKLLTKITMFFMIGLMPINLAHAAEKTDLDNAKIYVTTISKQTITLLQDESIAASDKMNKMYAVLEDTMAYDVIGRIVLGKPYRGLTDDQKSEYDVLFKEYLLTKYSSLVGSYNGQDVEITKSVRAGKADAMVFTKIGVPGQEGIVVGWRIRTIKGEMKLLDVKIADLSMVQTERDQFQNVYQNHKIDGILKALRSLTEKMQAKRQS